MPAVLAVAVASIMVSGWRGRKYVGDSVGDMVHVVRDSSREVADAGNCAQGEDTRKQRVFDQILS